VQNCNTHQGTNRQLNRRPDQHLINLAFERLVSLVGSFSIFKATVPALFLLASWATVLSTPFSHDDAQVQLRNAMSGVRPLGSLPDFLTVEAMAPLAVTAATTPSVTLTKAQTNLVQQLSSLYEVSADELSHYVVGAYNAARELKVDPLLVLAIMSIESSFDPEAQSHAGAQGLMQVLTRVHADKFAPFGGVKAAFDINANIHVGTRIIKEYLTREGSIEGALKSYVGAALMSDDGGYGYKVMAQMERLRAMAAGKPIPNIPDRRPDNEAVLAQSEKANLQSVLNEMKTNPDLTAGPSPAGQVVPTNFSAGSQSPTSSVTEPAGKAASQSDSTAVEL
jgi:hypothetical protein